VSRVRARGEDVRRFILENVEKNATTISTLTAKKFGITRQAVNKHLHRLTAEKALAAGGNTRNRNYKLAPLSEWQHIYDIDPTLAEDVVWTRDVFPQLNYLPENVLDIWHYCFTEMFNNALDHSSGSQIYLRISKTAANTQLVLSDNGIGIFKKIQTALNLADERHALLELAKGKLTTDPEKHTGQGIFFTSRLLDSFDILSGGVYYSHEFGHEEDWIAERASFESGTTVFMKLYNHTARTCKKIFDQYSSGDDYGFTKTVVPVRLAQYGNDKLISRSQAKRVLARVELFKVVILNFEGVPLVGQAFADEIFRVFTKANPQIQLYYIKANSEVKRVIEAAKAERPAEPPQNLSLF
jgi:anti-sigma regulatory factor (Ser/Thr protein kinase)